MPDASRLLRTFERAITAFRETPGRHGRIVHLQHAHEVLVVGDLHGNIENFRALLGKAKLREYPDRHLVLQELIHGPFRYPGGGDKSHQLVDLLAALKCEYPHQVHMLLGNHELSQWTTQAIGKSDEELNALFRAGVDAGYGSRAAELYAAYMQLFCVVPLAVRTANRVFLSHSLPSASRLDRFDPALLERDISPEEELRPGGMIHALVWGRDTRPATAAAFLQKVDADLLITGHIASERGFDVPNDRQVILDALGTPACYCLFAADTPLSHSQLVASIHEL
jgi:hypothetical protein